MVFNSFQIKYRKLITAKSQTSENRKYGSAKNSKASSYSSHGAHATALVTLSFWWRHGRTVQRPLAEDDEVAADVGQPTRVDPRVDPHASAMAGSSAFVVRSAIVFSC